MPSYEAMKSKYNHLSPTQLTRIIYRYYKAISSEAYLLQTKGSLLTDIFHLFADMKRAKQDKKGMNDVFDTLTENLEGVSRKVLDLSRNEEEDLNLFRGDKARNTTSMFNSFQKDDVLPSIVTDALLLNVKGVGNDKMVGYFTPQKCI